MAGSTEVGNIHYALDLDDSKFKGKAKSAGDEVGGLAGKFKEAEGASKIFAAGIAAVGVGLVAFGVSSVKAFSAQQDAIARLDAGLTNIISNHTKLKKGSEELTQAVAKNSQELQKQAAALQLVTRFADEDIISGQGMLTTFELSTGAIKKLTPSMLDMAEAMRRTSGETIDMNQLGIMFGKVMGGAADGIAGLATGLRKMGVVMTQAQMDIFKTGTEMERANTLAQIIDFNFGGFAKAGGKTFAGQWDIMKNKINDFQEAVGQMLANAITPLITAFNDWFTAMGGPLGILDKLKTLIKDNELAVWALTGAIIAGLLPAMKGLVDWIYLSLIEPLWEFWAVGAIVGGAIFLLVQQLGGWKAVMSDIKGLMDGVNGAIQPIVDQFHNLWTEISHTTDTVTPLGQALKPIYDAFVNIGGAIEKTFSKSFSDVWFQLQVAFEAVGKAVSEQLWPALQNLWVALQPIMPYLEQFAMFLVVFVVAAIVIFVGVLTSIIQAIAMVLPFIIEFVTGIIQFFTGLIEFFQGLFTGNMQLVWQGFMDMLTGVWNFVVGFIATVLGFFYTFVTSIIQFFQNLYDAIVGKSIIPDLVNAILMWIAKLAASFLLAIASMVVNVIGAFVKLWNGIVAEVSTWPAKMYEWGTNLIKSFGDGIWAAKDWVINKIKDLLDAAKKFVQGNSPPIAGPFKDIDKWGFNVGSSWIGGFQEAFRGFGLPSLGDMGLAGTGIGVGGGSSSQNINIYVDKIAGDQDVTAIGRELGFRLSNQP